jgi:hypothetical protein
LFIVIEGEGQGTWDGIHREVHSAAYMLNPRPIHRNKDLMEIKELTDETKAVCKRLFPLVPKKANALYEAVAAFRLGKFKPLKVLQIGTLCTDRKQ